MVTWNIDNLKSSYINLKGNNQFQSWLRQKYASNQIGEIKAVGSKKHNYFAITLNFTTLGVLNINMTQFVKKLIKEFPKQQMAKQNVHRAKQIQG
jgi:hypothetical protein